MKFGRYLADNQTPEWKRAYIDYRACKKAIKAIGTRLGQSKGGQASQDSSDNDADHGPSAAPKASPSLARTTSKAGSGSIRGSATGTPGTGIFRQQSRRTPNMTPAYGATSTSPRPIRTTGQVPPPLDLGEASLPDDSQLSLIRSPKGKADSRARKGTVSFSPDVRDGRVPAPGSTKRTQPSDDQLASSDSRDPLNAEASGSKLTPPPTTPKPSKSPRFLQSPRFFPGSKTAASPRLLSRKASIQSASTVNSRKNAQNFDELYNVLDDDEKAFFDLLDGELDKVENFYVAREQEAARRGHEISNQLGELAEHRKVFHELYPEGLPEWEVKVGRMLPEAAVRSSAYSAVSNVLHLRHPSSHPQDNNEAAKRSNLNGKPVDGISGMDECRRKTLRDEIDADREHHIYSPEKYQKYKKELKAAVLEYHRYLELVQNYRIMNLTGFRKALKKFEKATSVQVLELYTDEKIHDETFSRGETMVAQLKMTEDLYSEHFEHGDTKRARDKLRNQSSEKTHYRSVYRSGVYIGLGLPAAVFALVLAMQEDTQKAIPNWNGLLELYSALYLPVIFALLFELNLNAFVSARINYEFVMELSKPTIDYRSYAEIPSVLFLTLSYCFFFSFYQIGASHVAPTTWPGGWLVLLLAFFFNPLPIFRRQSRYWLLRVLFRVFTPGYSRVEFIAFFLADELNSLVYTMQNIYFVGCAYGHHWPANVLTVCPIGKTWPYGLFLCLPAMSRFIQCLKRWYDSRLGIHLINAGKYFSVMSQLCLFVVWRHRGSPYHDPAFAVWIAVASLSATYAAAWDIIVDWSLLRPHARLLRPDLAYRNPHIYYFAMITNVLIRFVFIWYTPYPTRYTRLRSFLFAMAEMLRRWQWNFFRVETEHLGNADAYRVTREIPLPYRRVEHDSDEEDRAKSHAHPLSVRLDRIRKSLVGEAAGRGLEALNVGPRGHASQRDYEARRPGDSTRSLAAGNENEQV